MEIDDTVRALLQHNEERLLRPDVRKSGQKISELISDEFIEIGSSGKFYAKQDVIDTLSHEAPFEGVISNFRSQQLTTEIILTTYTLEQTSNNAHHNRKSIRSSLWKLEQDQWKIIFHQGTVTIDS